MNPTKKPTNPPQQQQKNLKNKESKTTEHKTELWECQTSAEEKKKTNANYWKIYSIANSLIWFGSYQFESFPLLPQNYVLPKQFPLVIFGSFGLSFSLAGNCSQKFSIRRLKIIEMKSVWNTLP